MSHLESALIKKYVISKERIKWKSSVSNLIFFLKKCEENNMVFFDENESEADLAYRCFYPHEISNGKINKEKDSYILKTLQSEKSKIVNKEIVPTFDISFEH
ncbi:hypothetical protein [Plebeiibacterium sediminum]|uniref:Uncharacterized protein n=1 Tax=Plebeiibacterium sediminum TaxID=2992112 RepID=A0AAE3M9K7_9BACT|nr:hypothetical protein [Plebeiobacterium sediminum]MCW3789350.1 hypothetical protein [Plebeiobacterium sediminum]